jgi:hypothetical protein
MRSPLLPTWDELAAPNSGWAKRLSCALGIVASKSAARPRAIKLYMDGAVLSREGFEAQMSFARSPASRQLLEFLAGESGSVRTKREIHEQLSGSTYLAEVHDARLHKLLKRLSDRVAETLGAQPWIMPGNNSVELTVDLDVR